PRLHRAGTAFPAIHPSTGVRQPRQRAEPTPRRSGTTQASRCAVVALVTKCYKRLDRAAAQGWRATGDLVALCNLAREGFRVLAARGVAGPGARACSRANPAVRVSRHRADPAEGPRARDLYLVAALAEPLDRRVADTRFDGHVPGQRLARVER